MSELLRVDPIILIFSTMNMFKVKCVSQYKLNLRIKAGIGQPVPVEGAFANYGEIMAVRFDSFEKVIEIVALDVGV